MSTIRLTKPIQAHGETVFELTLREPTGKDIREAGFPFEADGKGFAEPKMAKMIARLAGIPPSSVDALSMADWLGAAALVADFLAISDPKSPIGTSTSPISSDPTSNG